MDEVCEKDKDGNILKGNVLAHDCNDSIVYGQDRLIATLGLTNTVVVDTQDALLVCAKDRAQDVKKLVEELDKKGCSEVKTPATVKKPWGSYRILDSGNNFLLKRIEVCPGESLSLQSHKHRSEHWTIAKGSAKVELNEDTFHLEANESIIIPLNAKHRLGNSGSELLSPIIKLSVGPYNPSIPTSPNTCLLASVTHLFPGPQIISTLGIVSVP